MRLNKFLFLLVLLVFIFFIQYLRLFSVNGINPNLVLIAFTAISFFRVYHKLTFIILILFFLGIIILFLDTFWLFHLIVISFLALTGYFLNLRLTGNIIFDYLIYLTICNFFFYIFTNISFLKSLPWTSIFTEFIYNFVLSLLLILIIKLKKIK